MSDFDILAAARLLASQAEVEFDRAELCDWGLSSDLGVLFRDDQPIAVAKANRGFVSRVHAEVSSIEHLASFDLPVPHLMADSDALCPAISKRTLLLSWVPGAVAPDTNAPRAADWAQSCGKLVATLHQIDASGTQLRLASDPLPLDQRMLRQCNSACQKLANLQTRELALQATSRLAQILPDLPFIQRVIHRDLRDVNFAWNSVGQPVGLVDFEHAAASDPAWDFAKIKLWLTPSADEFGAFQEGYTQVRPLPDADKIQAFGVHESVTMLGFFEKRQPEYVEASIRYLRGFVEKVA